MAIPDDAVSKIFEPLTRHRSIALAVSGGPDSVAMMHLADRWCDLHNFDRKFITVLTVDHCLRSRSTEEAHFVVRQAAALGFKAQILTWEQAQSKTANQQNARDARYALLLTYCRDGEITALLTAHTADDQAETLVMRLKRGSGLDGLASIKPVTSRDGVTILRPLLGMKKSTLLRFLQNKRLPFIDDPSNDNMKFERVGLRRQLTALAEAGVRRDALVLSASRLQRCRHALDRIVEEGMRKNFKLTPTGLGEFPRAVLDGMPDELRLRTVAAIIDLVGGASPSPRLVKLENLLPTLEQPRWQATLGGCVVVGRPSQVFVWRELGRLCVKDFTLLPSQSAIWDDRFEVTLDATANLSSVVRPLGIEGWKVLKDQDGALHREKQGFIDAARASPAIWEGSSLVSAPLLGWARNPGRFFHTMQLIPRLMEYVNEQDRRL